MKTYFKYLLILLSLWSNSSIAATFLVGQAHDYKTPNELYRANVIQDADTILIESEYFTGNQTLANWNKDRLVIKGINGQPELYADGKYIQSKGIWVLSGNNITVENIKFSGARVPDKNGAGIRLDGIGIQVRHCLFFNNENGILTSNPYQGHVLIEHSEFNTGGFGDGYSHNLYIGHVDTLTFRYNYSHHAIIGHALKSRANYNFIYYNRIMDEVSGSSSRLIDIPNGGFSIILGNILMQGPDAVNSNLVGFGLEGLSNLDSSELYFIHNTCINERISNGLFIDIKPGTKEAQLINNIFAGYGSISNGPISLQLNNYFNFDPDGLNFQDGRNYNYQLTSLSPVIDYCLSIDSIHGFNVNPKYVYQHPLGFKSRLMDEAPDAGAFELDQTVSTIKPLQNEGLLFPNPASTYLNLSQLPCLKGHYSIVNILGQMVQSGVLSSQILALEDLQNGMYFLVIRNGNERIWESFQVKY